MIFRLVSIFLGSARRIGSDERVEPINGISIEQYAELGADITDVMNDPEACARVVEARGVRRADWEAAKAGWTARMQDPSNMGQVATRYMALYQAALARKTGRVDVSFEDYVAMSGMAKARGLQGMLQHYGTDMGAWTQIAGGWNQKIPTDMGRYGMFGMLVEQEGARLQQGGAPRPVAITRMAGGGAAAGAPAAQGAHGGAYGAQHVENQMAAQAVQQQVAAAMASANAQAAAAYGAASANMGALGRGVMGMMGYGAIAQGIGPGMNVLVQWSDGNKYPARVVQVGGGQVFIALGDGRQLWVPESAVSRQ